MAVKTACTKASFFVSNFSIFYEKNQKKGGYQMIKL